MANAATPNLSTDYTEALGIVQGDVLIQKAIEAGIDDLRANPWFIDLIFAQLKNDDLTASVYGLKEIAQAKKWFLRTNIPVRFDLDISPANPVGICIAVVSSEETANTLGDVHYQPGVSANFDVSPTLTEAFTPTSYDPETGRTVLPTAISDALCITTRQKWVTQTGVVHNITKVESRGVIYLAPDLANLDFSTIRSERPSYRMSLESAVFKETYRVTALAVGEPWHCMYLHSILTWCLLRYRQALLEHRNYEDTALSIGPLTKFDVAAAASLCYQRSITLNGTSRYVWPKLLQAEIESLKLNIKIAGLETVEPTLDPEESLWTGEEDALNFFS